MSYEQRPGATNLFSNRKKGDNEKAPDYKGDISLEIDGQLCQLEAAVWERESQKAGKYLGLSLKLKLKHDRDSTRPNTGGRDQASHAERPDDNDLDKAMAPVDDNALRRQANQSFADASSKRRW
jgi:hypothetical protein